MNQLNALGVEIERLPIIPIRKVELLREDNDLKLLVRAGKTPYASLSGRVAALQRAVNEYRRQPLHYK